MTRISNILVPCLFLVACKGETVVKIDPQTKLDLDNCNKQLKDKQDLISQLQEQNTKLQTKPAAGEIVVAIEGNVLNVKPGKPGDYRPVDDAAARLASTQFVDLVRKSRGAIQKCYEQALKKNTGLQSKTITLTVSASFTQAGAYQSANFVPQLGDTFDSCMHNIATGWKLPQNSVAMTFRAPVTLTPL